MLVNEYIKPEFYVRKVRKMRNLGSTCLYLRVQLCYEQNRCAERTLYLIFKPLGAYKTQWNQILLCMLSISYASLRSAYGSKLHVFKF